ncbi:hypothetical protein L1987_87676 [Smallanthus sonchifolius]|nr:hypothetical protein L1987_87676 [Smallanthus sonchifolius]
MKTRKYKDLDPELFGDEDDDAKGNHKLKDYDPRLFENPTPQPLPKFQSQIYILSPSTMTTINTFTCFLTFTLLFTSSLFSDPSTLSPATATHLGSDDSWLLPSASPPIDSPPSPLPTSDLPPSHASTPSDLTLYPAPDTTDVNDLSTANVKTEEPKTSNYN